MNIYIDENIPYARDFFSDHGNLHFFSGRDVCAEQLKNADILLVRSITQVNEALLHLNTCLQFVGTATIGTDHIDLSYLQSRKIRFSSAPGCNKVSVAEYILSSLFVLAEQQQFELADKSVAIVGAGNTGSAVYQRLNALGLRCKLYDPPLEVAGDTRKFCGFDEVLKADIISLHVPKIKEGKFPTLHMFDRRVLQKLNTKQILLNASRGEIIDNDALLTLAKKGLMPTLVLDVWENEPKINKALLNYVQIATPHIAGYSLDGKARGTEMLYQAFCQHFSLIVQHCASHFLVPAQITKVALTRKLDLSLCKTLMHLVYDVRRDDALFRQMIDQTDGFDTMRKNYNERRELSTLKIDSEFEQTQLLQSLGLQS
ncbi:erythronate-4-phosphate dehydrogenase [Psychromonas sp. CNPT3]|uniref:4-phosphoerythronate dehydrogenase n=1 Tax=Psychromonas sp. CNPT3 TaxID=314282 RepID=UPI00006E80DD|nr:4-phosphoerythronate dehydrogenase [Psychromonas sp. CNPT3]AGH81119.1 erythronate-4-phosphate dehydrogenase [Psychromonas sp. CNPT3]